MHTLIRRLAAPSTYRRLTFVLAALPLGHVWFTALVVGWSLSVSLLITPLGILLLIGLAAATRGFARVEAALARGLLDLDLRAGSFPARGGGFWRFLREMLGGPFWRVQGYLLLRWFPGVPIAVALIALIAGSAGMIFAPMWVPFVHGGADLGFWQVRTVWQALALVPVGLALLPASILLGGAVAGPYVSLAPTLLADRGAGGVPQGAAASTGEVGGTLTGTHRRGRLRAHAAADSAVLAVVIAVWALTSHGYFWPVWVGLPLAMALAIHAWFVLLAERPPLLRRIFPSRTLAGYAGVCAIVELYLIAIWAVTGAGYFWPVWPLLGMAAVVGVQVVAAFMSAPREAELTERIDTLEASRAGAVDEQESELRRIERDLHDGAQARLVALGMSLGMAEHTLAHDPRRAGELLAEARVGAEQALRELRDLARGIHPPVLSDRGLGPAIAALASSTPLPVTVSAELSERLPSTIESAAYFVAAEALANAAKHAQATRVQITVRRVGDTLELEVFDDGGGGADPAGGGLGGLRRRVEALDGKLSVSSPPGGPTTIRAELPCGS
jgi:signal transduction histidine kinase